MTNESTQRSRRSRRSKSTAVALSLATAVGLLLGVGPRWFATDSASTKSTIRVDPQRSVQKLNLPGAARGISDSEVLNRLKPTANGDVSRAITAIDAVAGFFDAQVASKQEAAYAFLSSADRSKFPSAAAWRAQRREVLPDVTGYKVGNIVTTSTSAATVALELRFHAMLDETIGLIPASATASVHAVRENNTWRVALHESTTEFSYLSTKTLGTAASKWIEARRACGVAQQWRSTLYGNGAEQYARSMCRQNGAVELSAPQTLTDRTDTAALIAAFGPKVGLWARTVSVHAPVEFDLVLAPVDHQWLVIGVLTSPWNAVQG